MPHAIYGRYPLCYSRGRYTLFTLVLKNNEEEGVEADLPANFERCKQCRPSSRLTCYKISYFYQIAENISMSAMNSSGKGKKSIYLVSKLICSQHATDRKLVNANIHCLF